MAHTHKMEAHTLSEIIKNQQESILSLTFHLDCLIEELAENELIDVDRLEKRIKKKIKKLQSIADKLKENEEPLPPMAYFGGPIGEA